MKCLLIVVKLFFLHENYLIGRSMLMPDGEMNLIAWIDDSCRLDKLLKRTWSEYDWVTEWLRHWVIEWPTAPTALRDDRYILSPALTTRSSLANPILQENEEEIETKVNEIRSLAILSDHHMNDILLICSRNPMLYSSYIFWINRCKKKFACFVAKCGLGTEGW